MGQAVAGGEARVNLGQLRLVEVLGVGGGFGCGGEVVLGQPLLIGGVLGPALNQVQALVVGLGVKHLEVVLLRGVLGLMRHHPHLRVVPALWSGLLGQLVEGREVEFAVKISLDFV